MPYFISVAQSFLRMVSLSDIIDVVIVAFLIYKLLQFIRRTRSGQIAMGVLLVIAALWVSTLFHLNVINYLLTMLIDWAPLAIVILFQPEIRRFLSGFGSKRFHVFFKPSNEPIKSTDAAITQTVLSYSELSRAKIGALTVFERKNMLDDVIKTGTRLDATVSSELLKNIFWPKAPMHDGAVIIRDGVIAGAGCMLPLSSNVNLSRDLGMRHRAGIGMSENSDAVVVIVSEETGSISVAIDGMLKRHLTPETLERVLRKELLPQEEEQEQKSPLDWLRRGGGGNDKENL